MRNTLLTLAAAAFLLAGCSKDELTENAAEGVSSIATPTNSHARLGNPDNQPDVWFNENQGRMLVKYNGIGTLPRDCRPTGRIVYSIAGGEDPDGNATEETIVMEADLQRIGNSNLFRSAQNAFNFAPEVYFSMVDLTIDWNFDDSFPQDESRYEAKLFLYPSGRTVEQDPKIFLRRFHIQETIDAQLDAEIVELAIVIADDPAQEVAQVKFVPNPVYPNPDDPTYAVYPEPSYLEKTHENQNLGLSRWAGIGRGGAGSSGSFGGTIYMFNGGGDLVGNYNFILEIGG